MKTNTEILTEWMNRKASKWKANGFKMFMGYPDAWWDRWTVVCTTGHVSNMVVKSEVHGSLCMECGCKCVIIAPPRTSERFIMSMLNGKRLRPAS